MRNGQRVGPKTGSHSSLTCLAGVEEDRNKKKRPPQKKQKKKRKKKRKRKKEKEKKRVLRIWSAEAEHSGPSFNKTALSWPFKVTVHRPKQCRFPK